MEIKSLSSSKTISTWRISKVCIMKWCLNKATAPPQPTATIQGRLFTQTLTNSMQQRTSYSNKWAKVWHLTVAKQTWWGTYQLALPSESTIGKACKKYTLRHWLQQVDWVKALRTTMSTLTRTNRAAIWSRARLRAISLSVEELATASNIYKQIVLQTYLPI